MTDDSESATDTMNSAASDVVFNGTVKIAMMATLAPPSKRKAEYLVETVYEYRYIHPQKGKT